ncbi:MAG: hypothetical protein V9F03_04705 [Microthrixaceae bacterium]
MARHLIPEMRTEGVTTNPEHRTNQAGFALLGGMTVILLFAGVTLIALTSMTLTSSKVSEIQKLSTREVRAADNALESTVNMIRMDPDGELGDYKDCLGTTPISLPTNNQTVTVTATCEKSDRSMAVRDSALGAAPAVQLVGANGYLASSFPDNVPWKTDCYSPAPRLDNCFPWAYGFGPANYNGSGKAAIAGAVPSLVHSGAMRASGSTLNHTLNFASNVLVRRGTAAAVDPTTASAAINVAGRFAQGDRGLLGDSTNKCGLQTAGHVWNDLAARIMDSEDADGRPECEAADALALNDRAEITPRPGLGEQFTTFATVPSCSAGTVIEFSPGAYGRAQTAAINALLSGSCPNKVFWFKPVSATVAGNYWFDVDDPFQADATLRNSLIIKDPTARVIFGTPMGGLSASNAAAATFPAACNPQAAGVEVILSPRTSLRHTGGRVAICDRDGTLSTTNVPAALWQAGSVNNGWQGYPDPASSTATLTFVQNGISWGGNGFVNPSYSWRPDGSSSRRWFECNGALYALCTADATYQARGVGQFNLDGTAAPAPSEGRVDSLDLIVHAEVDDDNGFSLIGSDRVGTTITLYRAGESTPACKVYYPYKQRSMGAGRPLVLAFDLRSRKAQSIAGSTHCADADLTRSDLYGAGVDLSIRSRRTIYVLGWKTSNIYVDGMELRAGWDLEGTSASNVSNFSNPGNLVPAGPFAKSADGQHGGYSLQCSFWAWDGCPTGTATARVAGFDNAVVPWSPTDGSLRAAGLIVTGETTSQIFNTTGSFLDIGDEPDISQHARISFVVSNLRGVPGSCSVNWPKVPFWGQSIYIDLLNPANGNCNTLVTSAEQLIGATVDVAVYIERNQWGLEMRFGSRIDGIRFSTVTDGQYTRPQAPNLITIGDGPSANSSFNIFGQLSMPRNDLNIRWNGPSPRTTEGDPMPIGGGNMIMSGLGSFIGPNGEAGVLCCSPSKPAERIVTLTAIG